MPENLYVHFPFCRRKCSYCALHSRAGVAAADRDAYAARLADEVVQLGRDAASDAARPFKTVYFGGGSPALCDLSPLFDALAPHLSAEVEFTVELHPLDVAPSLLKTLRAGGVNRISMGVQSLDDAVLADMGRGYAFADAERAFAQVRESFDNVGIDLIVGYPGEGTALTPRHARLANWGLAHRSVYSLILEEKSALARRLRTTARGGLRLPSDEDALNGVALASRLLAAIGLSRYEISSYAAAGRECRHNLAVWRGEDYLGLGEGAHGRIGRERTYEDGAGRQTSAVDPLADFKERALFRLRLREGLDLAQLRRHSSAVDVPCAVDVESVLQTWARVLDASVQEGLLVKAGESYRLTERGTEVCDSILAELV